MYYANTLVTTNLVGGGGGGVQERGGDLIEEQKFWSISQAWDGIRSSNVVKSNNTTKSNVPTPKQRNSIKHLRRWISPSNPHPVPALPTRNSPPLIGA